MVQAQAELKARTKEVAALKEQASKKSSTSDETLSPLLERAQKEAELALNQLAHVEAEVRNLRGSCEELQSALHCLANSEAKITRLKELVQNEKLVIRLISFENFQILPPAELTKSRIIAAIGNATIRSPVPLQRGI